MAIDDTGAEVVKVTTAGMPKVAPDQMVQVSRAGGAALVDGRPQRGGVPGGLHPAGEGGRVMARDDGQDRPVFYINSINSAYIVGTFADQVSGRIDVTVRPGDPAGGSTAANARLPHGGVPGWDGVVGQVEELHGWLQTADSADPADVDPDSRGSRTGVEAGQ